jgi:hypothetical protein
MTDLANVTVERSTCVKIARSRRKAPSKPATVTATELGEHLGLTRQRISVLADTEHVIERLADGRFDQDDCRLRYLRWLRDPARRAAKSAAASEFTAAKTELIRMRIAEKQRTLIPIDDAIATTDAIVGIMLTKLSGMGARVSRDLTIRRAIDAVIFEIRTEIANEAHKMADARGEPREEDGAA